MKNFLYGLGLHVVAVLSLPFLLYKLLVKGKYRKSLLNRFGKGFPVVEKGDKKLIWIHAVSVGETKAVANLVKNLKNQNFVLLISSITETGHEEAKKTIPHADYHVYLPFDFGYVIGPIVKQVKPDLVLLCETDFWYNFLSLSKKNGAKIAVVNGKLSKKSMQKYSLFGWLFRSLFKSIDLFCLQGEIYRQRFLNLGVANDKVVITGNLKLEVPCSKLSKREKDSLRSDFAILKSDLVIVFGSTHDPEEKIFLNVLEELWQEIPNLKAMFVPRHPERFSKVESLMDQRHPVCKFSEIDIHNGSKLILIDTMGKLQDCYQIADLAIVAGSYTSRVGGHNILEPSRYGVPVIYGPHMETQPDLVDLAKSFDVGSQVVETDLVKTIRQYLNNKELRLKKGSAGLELFRQSQGATSKTFTSLKKVLP